MRAFAAAGLMAVLLTGCTHAQLRKSTLQTASILPDLQHQQVLDNLARFCANPDSLPYFAVTAGGTVQVGDSGNGSITLAWDPTGLVSEVLNLGAARVVSEQYDVGVVVDPSKLDVMRAAYQWTLGLQTDINRQKLTDYFGEEFELTVPSEPWFNCGPCDDVPKCACYVGKHCHTAVWVTPEGMDALTRFTLAILDVATSGDPIPPPTKEVHRRFQGPEGGRLLETEVITLEPVEEADAGETPRSVVPGETSPTVPRTPQRTRKDFYSPGRGLQFVPRATR